MNERQAKLLRYFVKHTGQLKMATVFKMGFDKLNHKKKGKLSKWIKQSIVLSMAVRKEQKKQQLATNLDTLKSFSSQGTTP